MTDRVQCTKPNSFVMVMIFLVTIFRIERVYCPEHLTMKSCHNTVRDI